MGSFIDHFQATVGGAIISPPQFVFWAGVSLVSCIIGRMVYTTTFMDHKSGRLYANLFLGLVGPPGSGKTLAIREARKIAELLGVNMGPADMYGEKIADILKVDPLNPNPSPGTMALLLDEFDSIMHAGTASVTKQILCQLYDCTEKYERTTYSHGTQLVRDACLTLIGGCTPAHLHKFFTPLEWQEGLPSRLLLVYGERPPMAARYERGDMPALIRHAEEIMQFVACTERVGWRPEALEAYTQWAKDTWNHKTPHPLLGGYTSRRQLNAAKLSFVLSVARKSSLISLDDFHGALQALTQIETSLHQCLALSGGNNTKDVEHFLRGWMEDQNEAGVLEFLVRRMLASRLPHSDISAFIDEMIAQKVLRPIGLKPAPNRVFEGGKLEA